MNVVAKAGLRELVLMDLPAESRLGFLAWVLQGFMDELARLEGKQNESPTTLRKLTLEFSPVAQSAVFGDTGETADIRLRHEITGPGRVKRIHRNFVEVSGEDPEILPWNGKITTTLRRYWRADPYRWSGEVVFTAADPYGFW